MRIVDPHFHIWDLGSLPYPWLTTDPSVGVFGDNSAIRKSYSLDSYLSGSGEFEIVKSVHVEAAVGPRQAVDETVWIDQVADLGGQPDAIVGYCDLSSADAEVTLDAHLASHRLRGIRQILNTHQDERLNFVDQEFMENQRWVKGFPVDGMFSTFDALWSAYRNIATDLSVDEQNMLFGQTAERVYRI